jgi:hypothetical protein
MRRKDVNLAEKDVHAGVFMFFFSQDEQIAFLTSSTQLNSSF